MEKKNDDQWLLGKVGTEAEVELTSRCEVNSLPALQLFMGGVMVAEFIDLLPETRLIEWLHQAIVAATGP
jgi:thioredoxin-like negative regulator of GroEL